MKRATLAFVVGLCAACSRPSPRVPRSALPYVGRLVSTTDIQGDFFLRQRVHARFPGGDGSFEAVLQKQGEVLTLVGMTPFNTRAFVLRQRGTETEFESFVPQTMPFPPRYMLLDVHRVMFIGIAPAPSTDGEYFARRDGEEIRERWSAGRLVERHFRRLDGAPQGSIDIEYIEGMTGRFPPRTVRFRNGWYGYELVITTLAHRAL